MSSKTKLIKSMEYSIVRVNMEARGEHDAWVFKHLRGGEIVFTGKKSTQQECWDEIANFKSGN